MKKHITDIRIQNEQPAHCSIFMDGVFFALVEIGLVTKFGLRIGLEIEEIVIQKLIVADEVMRARNHALNLLLRESSPCHSLKHPLPNLIFFLLQCHRMFVSLDRN